MIIRLRMTPNGPERGTEPAASQAHASARGRRALIVVVDQALSATMPPGLWPKPLAPRETIVADWPGAARRYARSTLIARVRALRGKQEGARERQRSRVQERSREQEPPRRRPRPLLLPREALPVIRDAGRPGGIRRAVCLRRCRFRSLRAPSRRTGLVLIATTLLVPALVLVTLTTPGVFPVETARSQSGGGPETAAPASGGAPGSGNGHTAGHAAAPGPGQRAAERARPVGVLAATELARAEEAVRTRALRESRVSLPPARLLLALAAVLEADERLLELQIEQSSVQALIAGSRPHPDGGRAALATRVGSITGMRVVRHESRERANGMVTRVHAVLRDPEPHRDPGPGEHSSPLVRETRTAGRGALMSADERAEYVAGHVRAAASTARTAANESGVRLVALSADPVNGTVEAAVRAVQSAHTLAAVPASPAAAPRATASPAVPAASAIASPTASPAVAPRATAPRATATTDTSTMATMAAAPVVGWLTALEALCERGTTVLIRMTLHASAPPLTARVVLAVAAPEAPPPFVAGATASQVRAWSLRWPAVGLHEVGTRLGTDEAAAAAHARTANGSAAGTPHGSGDGGRRRPPSEATAAAGGEASRNDPAGRELPADQPTRPRHLGTITVGSRRLLALMHEETVRLVEDGEQLDSWVVDADHGAGVVPAEGGSYGE